MSVGVDHRSSCPNALTGSREFGPWPGSKGHLVGYRRAFVTTGDPLQ